MSVSACTFFSMLFFPDKHIRAMVSLFFCLRRLAPVTTKNVTTGRKKFVFFSFFFRQPMAKMLVGQFPVVTCFFAIMSAKIRFSSQ